MPEHQGKSNRGPTRSAALIGFGVSLLIGVFVTLQSRCKPTPMPQPQPLNVQLFEVCKQSIMGANVSAGADLAGQAQALLDEGADVEYIHSSGGWTLLQYVVIACCMVQGCDTDVLSVLIKAGADVNAKFTDGKTPLMHAATGQCPEVFAMLLNAGSDTAITDDDGKTALDYARNNDVLRDTESYQKLKDASLANSP